MSKTKIADIAEQIKIKRKAIAFSCSYLHKKSQNVYFPTDVTFDFKRNRFMVTYFPITDNNCVFTRDYDEFLEKFERVDTKFKY